MPVKKKTTVIPAAETGSLPKIADAFTDLLDQISTSKSEYERLLKEIAEAKLAWVREQQEREINLKRDAQTYEYETNLVRKKAEDEFSEKKLKWERELMEQKDVLVAEHRELEELRKQVTGFPIAQEKAVKDACTALQKELEEKSFIQQKLREQEIKAEKDVLNLKLSTLETENLRQAKEIEVLKKSLETATVQVKDIAVKVIESGKDYQKTSVSSGT